MNWSGPTPKKGCLAVNIKLRRIMYILASVDSSATVTSRFQVNSVGRSPVKKTLKPVGESQLVRRCRMVAGSKKAATRTPSRQDEMITVLCLAELYTSNITSPTKRAKKPPREPERTVAARLMGIRAIAHSRNHPRSCEAVIHN